MPAALKSEPDDEELIERFRRKIQEELGWVALAVFDARMEGEDTKSLVGQSELDYATSYRVKKIVQQIKSLAREFGDEEFRAMVDRAMDFEKGVMDRRFGIRAPGA